MIRFECPAGHKIKADAKLAGRTAACPACGTPVAVPQPAAAITETGALRLLNACGNQAPTIDPQPPAQPSPTKSCPRCQVTLSSGARICWSCRLDVGPASDAWKSVVRAAARYVKSRRAS